MGADLIAFVSFGPSEIEESKASEAGDIAAKRLVELKEAAADLLVSPESEDAAAAFPDPSGAKHAVDYLLGDESFDSVQEVREDPASIDAIQEIFVDGGIHSELAHAEESDVRSLAGEFIDFWNADRLYRNATYRTDPDNSERKVVVAGERSWGDEPEGAYALVRKALNLQITDFFDIHV